MIKILEKYTYIVHTLLKVYTKNVLTFLNVFDLHFIQLILICIYTYKYVRTTNLLGSHILVPTFGTNSVCSERSLNLDLFSNGIINSVTS